MRKNCFKSPWFWGIVLATLLLLCLYCTIPVQFALNDDAYVLRSSMGYEGGEPATFHRFMHTVFAWLLYGLNSLVPALAWYTLLQIFLLWLSAVVIIKSFAQLANRRGFPIWIGILVSLLFLGPFALFNLIRITHTFTATLCGVASIAQMLSIDFSDRPRLLPRIIGSIGMLLCSYLLRDFASFASLAFWLLVIIIKLMSGFGRRKEPWAHVKPVFLSVIGTGLLLLFFAGVRVMDIRMSGAQDYVRWQDARLPAMDYLRFENASNETLQAIDWSINLRELAGSWYFLDDRINAGAFETITEQIQKDSQQSLPALIRSSGRKTLVFFSQEHQLLTALISGILMAASGLFITAALKRRIKWTLIGVVFALAGGAIFVLILVLRYQLISRAVMCAFGPMGIILYGSVFSLDESTSCQQKIINYPPKKWLIVVTALSLTATLAMNGFTSFQSLREAIRTAHTSVIESIPVKELDRYALRNPQFLFIHDWSLTANEIAFPDVTEGIPTNVIFWGGWQIGLPSWWRTMEAFGITKLSPEIFLRNDVVFATRYNEPPKVFLDYLQENTQDEVHWELIDTYDTIYFYQFSTN